MRDGWIETSIGDICTLEKGLTPTLKANPGEYPLVVTAADFLSSSEYQIDGEAVCVPLVSSTGHGHASLKRVHYASGKFAVANIIAALQARPGAPIRMKYLGLLLDHGRNEIIVPLMKGTANVSLSMRSLSQARITLPPLREQERIVDLIAAVDETIEKADRGEKQLREAIRRMRDVVLWSAHERVPVGTLFQVDGSLVSPVDALARLPHVGTDRIESGSGAVFGVRTAAEDGVTSGKYRFNERHVVYSKIRPNLQKVAIPTFHGLCSADAYPLLPKEGVPRRYLQQLLLSTPFTEQAVARSGRTKMPKINRVELESIPVPVHSAAEMHEWAGLFEALDRAATDARAEVSSLRDMRSNLLSALLSGEHVIPESYDEVMGVVSNVVE